MTSPLILEIIILANAKPSDIDTTWLPFWGGLIGSSIGAVAAIYGSYKIGKTKQKELLVQTISGERIRWINNLRDEFVNFNKEITIFKQIVEDNGDIITKDENQQYERLISSIYRMKLLLNPAENYMKCMIFEIDSVAQADIGFRGNYDLLPYYNARRRIEDLQQVIIKAEWARVKKESRLGKELNNKQIEEIYDNTARAINDDILKYVNEWKVLEQSSNDFEN